MRAPYENASGTGRRRKKKSALIGFYKVVVFVASLIVIGYVSVNMFFKPAQKDVPAAPPQAGTEPGAETPAAVGRFTRREGVYTVFLAATDKGGSRTDTMMVACYDIPNQKVGLVSVPRDTLIGRKSGNPRLVYGPGGVEERAKDVSQILGIPIDYYVKVDLDGFIALVDYLGGVDFNVPCDMDYDDPYQDLYIHFKAGLQHLDGQQAMEVARFRKNNGGAGYSDMGRTATQQQLLVAMAKKALSWGSLTKLNGFAEIFHQYVETDLSVSDLLYFASQATGLDTSAGIETATLEGRGDGVYNGVTYCYELDDVKSVETVNRLINPYHEEITLSDMWITNVQKYMS